MEGGYSRLLEQPAQRPHGPCLFLIMIQPDTLTLGAGAWAARASTRGSLAS